MNAKIQKLIDETINAFQSSIIPINGEPLDGDQVEAITKEFKRQLNILNANV
jgi:hypothetical protein